MGAMEDLAAVVAGVLVADVGTELKGTTRRDGLGVAGAQRAMISPLSHFVEFTTLTSHSTNAHLVCISCQATSSLIGLQQKTGRS